MEFLYAVVAILLMAIAYGCLTIKTKPEAVVKEVSWVPSKSIVFFELDWVCGVIKLSCTPPGYKHLVKVELHQSQLGYTRLAADMHQAMLELCDQLMGLDHQEAVMELDSWNIVVSTTGRAHNALPSSTGWHPAVLMQSALDTAFKVN